MVNRDIFQAKEKLKESKFFLEKMKNTKTGKSYHFSAFLSAWRSVLDVLLYDYAILFEIGFSREEKMDPKHFQWAAKRLENEKALEFFSWWNAKIRSLQKNPLWEQRIFSVHRGYPEDNAESVYTPASISSGYETVVSGYAFRGHGLQFKKNDTQVELKSKYQYTQPDLVFPDTIIECEKALQEMETIVNESFELFMEKGMPKREL